MDFLLRLLAAGWTEDQVLENYPQVSPQDLRSLFAFAAECTREGTLHQFDGPAMS